MKQSHKAEVNFLAYYQTLVLNPQHNEYFDYSFFFTIRFECRDIFTLRIKFEITSKSGLSMDESESSRVFRRRIPISMDFRYTNEII